VWKVNNSDNRFAGPQLIVALDYPGIEPAVHLARQLDPRLCRMKVGKELFTAAGPKVVENLQALGFEVFLDLKFHDIPNTTASACRSAAELGVWMLNVHASGGETMMRAAYEAVQHVPNPPLLIAVTVLTSLDRGDLEQVGIACDPAEQVLRLARLSEHSGLDGVVCAASDLPILREQVAQGFLTVTPGVRPQGTVLADQKRVTTPTLAMAMGASYLVIGRPITQADNPVQALSNIVKEINASKGF